MTFVDVQIQMLPGSELSDINNLNITSFSLSYQSDYEIRLQLEFEKPGYISVVLGEKDILDIEFKNLT